MKQLYFVRHGLSEMNKIGLFSGRTETPLAAEGISQAHASGVKARELGIDCIVTSPMKRAVDTANIIADELDFDRSNILVSELLMERGLGPLEGQAYTTDVDLDSIDGVESDVDILERSQEALDYLRSLPQDNILVVSHGALGRALRHTAQPAIPFHGSERFDNAQLVRLV
jgi:uncharacterized phosphatase